jgi:hypothetical protein
MNTGAMQLLRQDIGCAENIDSSGRNIAKNLTLQAKLLIKVN